MLLQKKTKTKKTHWVYTSKKRKGWTPADSNTPLPPQLDRTSTSLIHDSGHSTCIILLKSGEVFDANVLITLSEQLLRFQINQNLRHKNFVAAFKWQNPRMKQTCMPSNASKASLFFDFWRVLRISGVGHYLYVPVRNRAKCRTHKGSTHENSGPEYLVGFMIPGLWRQLRSTHCNKNVQRSRLPQHRQGSDGLCYPPIRTNCHI